MDNSKELTILSLFSGYGGIERGIRRAGHKVNVLTHCEIESYPIANMVSKMETGKMDPTPIWTDVKTLPLYLFRNKVDVLTGGFPCQPFSTAGSRNADEDHRHLFPYVLKAAKEARPKYIFLENVAGILSAKLGGDGWADPKGTPVLLHVLRELERMGYRAEAGIFSAEEAGAPHQRKRVFILAELIGEHLNQPKPTRDKFYGVKVDELLTRWKTNEPTNWPAIPKEQQFDWEEPRVILNPNSKMANTSSEGLYGPFGNDKNSQGREEQIEHSTEKSVLYDGNDERMGNTSGQEQDPSSVKSTVGRTDNGIAIGGDSNRNRVDRIRMCGNGVVPQTAEIAWKTLMTRLLTYGGC